MTECIKYDLDVTFEKVEGPGWEKPFYRIVASKSNGQKVTVEIIDCNKYIDVEITPAKEQPIKLIRDPWNRHVPMTLDKGEGLAVLTGDTPGVLPSKHKL